MRINFNLFVSIFALGVAGCLATGTSLEGVTVVSDDKTVLSISESRPDGKGPFPGVILMHGCTGPVGLSPIWQRYLSRHGYYTISVDSFGPRGINEVCDKGGAYHLMEAEDAYAALDFTAMHPDIDEKNVAVMGFSHGGAVVLKATYAKAVSTFKLTGKPMFKAFVLIYPFCDHGGRWSIKGHSAPGLVIEGTEDDWTGPKAGRGCVRSAKGIKGGGKPIETFLIEGATHTFDGSFSGVNRFGYKQFADSAATKLANERAKDFLDRNLK